MIGLPARGTVALQSLVQSGRGDSRMQVVVSQSNPCWHGPKTNPETPQKVAAEGVPTPRRWEAAQQMKRREGEASRSGSREPK